MNFMDLDSVFEFFFTSSYNAEPPELMDVLSKNIGLIAVFALLSLLSCIGLYGVWVKIYGKEKAYLSLVPFYNFFRLFRAVNLSPYLSFTIFLPVVGLIPLAIFNFLLPRALGLNGIVYAITAIFFPWLILLILGFDKQYEYQYQKGKNVPFEEAFRIPVPGEEGYDAANTPNEVDAIGSQISQAAALNMERNKELRREAAAREAEKAAEEEQNKQPGKPSATTISYDIFDNGTIEPSSDETVEEPSSDNDISNPPVM